MANLLGWCPLGTEHEFDVPRKARVNFSSWRDSTSVSFAPHLGISPRLFDETNSFEIPKRSQRPTKDGSLVTPVMPFVRANGEVGLIPLMLTGFGLEAEDLLENFDESSDESKSDSDNELGHLAQDSTSEPWNLTLLDGLDSEQTSLFRAMHTHDFAQKLEVKPRGLYNTRNMCFFNSVLQVLIHTPAFYSLISDLVLKVALRMESNSGPNTPPSRVLVALTHFFYHYEHAGDGDSRYPWSTANTKRAISGEDLYNVICTQPRFHVERDRQEDAQEFMSDLIDSLETAFRDAKPTSDDIRDDVLAVKRRLREVQNGVDDENGWTEIGSNHRKVETQHAGRQDRENPIDELFGGRFRSTLTKQGCKPSITIEPFQQIMLDISESGVDSVQTAVESLLKDEELMLDSTAAIKQTQLEQLPPVLIVHIKRFTFMMQHGDFEMGKITKSVLIDGVLRLTCVGQGVVRYRPIGVIYHHGFSATRGHYTADVKVNNQWFKIDDEQVVPVDTNEVVGHDSVGRSGSRSAYMVFYEKC